MDNANVSENISFMCGAKEGAQPIMPVVLGFMNLIGILNNIYLVNFAFVNYQLLIILNLP